MKTKKIKSEPLFDKEQLKGIAERAKLLRQIFSESTLDDLLDLTIKNRMFESYLKKHNININQIENEYKDELNMIYETVMSDKYKKTNRLQKKLIKTLNEGKYKKTKNKK